MRVHVSSGAGFSATLLYCSYCSLLALRISIASWVNVTAHFNWGYLSRTFSYISIDWKQPQGENFCRLSPIFRRSSTMYCAFFGHFHLQMTVSYNITVSSVTAFSFIRLLFRWRGSIWKSVIVELLSWILAYYVVFFIYRFALSSDEQR